MAEPAAVARGSNLAGLRLTVDGVKFGRYLGCRHTPGGVEFEGADAVRRMAGAWAVEFSFGTPRSMVVWSAQEGE